MDIVGERGKSNETYNPSKKNNSFNVLCFFVPFFRAEY